MWPVAGQSLPEPFMPGSGEKPPAGLRLVLGGYVAIACGLFVGGLACVAAALVPIVFVIFDAHIRSAVIRFDVTELFDDDIVEALCFAIPVGGLGFLGVAMAFDALEGRGRFSRLLRRPSDQRTATVVALKHGGRTLILDIPWDGAHRAYQPLSEVRLALWKKAGMLVPGERVTVYGGPGGENALLISRAQRARAFLGTMKARSTVQPGPVAPLDERVSAATLVDWAAWAAATTFSYTGLGSSYDTAEVEAFRSAVRDAFLGVGEPPVRSDDVRGKQFSTHWLWEGYDKKQVDAFLDAAALRLAAMESRDRPAEPLLVSGATLAAWAAWADSATFTQPRIGQGRGYTPKEVDALREEIRDTFLGATKSPVKSLRRRRLGSSSSEWQEVTNGVRGAHFSKPSSEDGRGYDEKQVHAFLDAAGIRLAAMEATDGPEETTGER